MQEQLNSINKSLELLPIIDSVGSDDPEFWSRSILTTLAKIHDTAHQISRDTAITVVKSGDTTRREAAELIGVHPITISRWITQRETATE